MDLYPKNPTTLRKLLAKRQNPCTQIFKNQQLSNNTNQPKTTVNFPEKSLPNARNTKAYQSTSAPSPKTKLSPQKSSQSSSTPRFSPNIQKAVKTTIITIEDDTDSFEKVEKKVKPTTTESSSRKHSFDEKDETDHSTTCDARSEGNATNEAPEFFWSPLLSTETLKDPAHLILDDYHISSPKSESLLHIIDPTESVSTYMKAQSQAEKLGGCCLSSNCSPNGKFKFRCQFRHQWEMTIEELEQRWCTRCEGILKRCRSFASDNGGRCLNDRLEDLLTFSCCQGHHWTISYKNYNTKWCSTCAQEEQDNLKRKCEEHRRKREQEEEEYQRKLFEEATRKVMENIMNKGLSEEEILSYFQKVDAEIEALAKEATAKFMSENKTCQNTSYQQALQVYKILLMPENILESYMSNLSPEILKGEYRRLAKIIHPDKNRHPEAGDAFKKIHKVYEVMVGKLERS